MASKSRKYTLNWRDLLRGFVFAALVGGLTTLYEAIENNAEPFSKATVIMALKAAFSAGIIYLIKNWLTDSNGKLITKKVKDDEPPLGI